MGKTEMSTATLANVSDNADQMLEGAFILIITNENYFLRAAAGSAEADQLHQLRQKIGLPNQKPERGWQQIVIKRRHPTTAEKKHEIQLKGSFAAQFHSGPFRLCADLDSESGEQLQYVKERLGKAHVRRPETHGRDYIEIIFGLVKK